MEINILQKYKDSDIDVLPVCEKIATDLNINNNVDIVLDLSGCLIGYNATCKIIDSLIKQLQSLEGKKTLEIKCDYKFPPDIIITLLFRGSHFIGEETISKTISPEVIEEKMKENLSGDNIEIILTINGKTSKFI